MRDIIRREDLHQADRSKLIPHIEYLEKELSFFELYKKESETSCCF